MDKQQVITCHGEIFISKLEHKLGASAASKEIKISIRSSKHYLLLAKKSYARPDLSSVVDGLIKELHGIPSLHELHADLKQLKGKYCHISPVITFVISQNIVSIVLCN